MSQIGKLTAFVTGLHVMGKDGLRDYHAAKAALDANRRRDMGDKVAGIKHALKNHRVTVGVWCGAVTVRRTTNGDGDVLSWPKSYHFSTPKPR